MPSTDTRFFDGNYEVRQGVKDHSYVLPLKKKYFDYFNHGGAEGYGERWQEADRTGADAGRGEGDPAYSDQE